MSKEINSLGSKYKKKFMKTTAIGFQYLVHSAGLQ